MSKIIVFILFVHLLNASLTESGPVPQQLGVPKINGEGTKNTSNLGNSKDSKQQKSSSGINGLPQSNILPNGSQKNKDEHDKSDNDSSKSKKSGPVPQQLGVPKINSEGIKNNLNLGNSKDSGSKQQNASSGIKGLPQSDILSNESLKRKDEHHRSDNKRDNKLGFGGILSTILGLIL